ncbi:hypothetical protein [Breoghania sp.]|uniref:hypothetical protein n=1 Tax=Breoghania sp. TaxID=2065378 RepID=UPI00262CB4EF|nr:hypothetical protein [Breoghania sp.]MDJ0931962.1 hypothetical protein [Breoghania sp.]
MDGAGHGDDLQGLTLRLEQRLGLPPHSAKTAFVEMEVEKPGDPTRFFRPCVSPDVTTSSCQLGLPPSCPLPGSGNDAEACHAHRDFYLNQYSSYGVALPTGYPWTSFGYTFDWAFDTPGVEGETDFVQYGESEYVIAKGRARHREKHGGHARLLRHAIETGILLRHARPNRQGAAKKHRRGRPHAHFMCGIVRYPESLAFLDGLPTASPPCGHIRGR